jgi:hypothetical protein
MRYFVITTVIILSISFVVAFATWYSSASIKLNGFIIFTVVLCFIDVWLIVGLWRILFKNVQLRK